MSYTLVLLLSSNVINSVVQQTVLKLQKIIQATIVMQFLSLRALSDLSLLSAR